MVVAGVHQEPRRRPILHAQLDVDAQVPPLSPAPVVLATAISGTHFFERETNAKYKA